MLSPSLDMLHLSVKQMWKAMPHSPSRSAKYLRIGHIGTVNPHCSVWFLFFPSHAAFLSGGRGAVVAGIPTRASLINWTLKIPEWGVVKQCFWCGILQQLANQIHVVNKRSNDFSPTQTTPFKHNIKCHCHHQQRVHMEPPPWSQSPHLTQDKINALIMVHKVHCDLTLPASPTDPLFQNQPLAWWISTVSALYVKSLSSLLRRLDGSVG